MIAPRLDPPMVRKGWLFAGLTLIGMALPMSLLGAMSLAASTAGALALTYAILPSGYPLLGTIASFALAYGVQFGALKLLIG